MKRFEKAEIDDDLGILKVTDINLYQLTYLMEEDAGLTLGRVWKAMTPDKATTVTFFVPAGGDCPVVLKVDKHS